MRELVFQIEFKSDIVLPASSNTEGNIEQQEFIAGSNFLGMVAQKYNDFSNPFDIFHSGKVRFGDGHILKDGKITYKMPFSFFHEKLDSTMLYNHHLIEDFSKFSQLKQKRAGFITEELQEVSIDYAYSQKSAYDKANRRSMDSQMYGYNAIKKGSTWQFTVKVDRTISNKDEQLIIETLETSKRLGKSKSAEYGQVDIKYINAQDEAKASLLAGEVFLYCNSRLALVDEHGNPTLELKYLCNGVEIVYEKTQIRTSLFTPYNGKRQTKDYERVCINKGSVIVVKNITNEQLQKIQNGVGAFLSEGFGEVLINPGFLNKRDFGFNKLEDKTEKIKVEITDDIAKFLAKREQTKNDTLGIANEVATFVNSHKKSTFSNIKPSQWGNIRSIASSNQDNFVENIRIYISNGAKKWDDKQIKTLMETIENHKINNQKFTKLLAMKMGGKND